MNGEGQALADMRNKTLARCRTEVMAAFRRERRWSPDDWALARAMFEAIPDTATAMWGDEWREQSMRWWRLTRTDTGEQREVRAVSVAEAAAELGWRDVAYTTEGPRGISWSQLEADRAWATPDYLAPNELIDREFDTDGMAFRRG